jgi:hypothetical protein
VTATFNNNLGLTIGLHDLSGSMVFKGNNVNEQVVGNRIEVTGTATSIQSVALSSSTRGGAVSFHTSAAGTVDVQSFTSTGPMGMLDLSDVNLTGPMHVLAAPRIVVGSGQNATIQIDDAPGLPLAKFQGGNFSNSQFTSTQPLSSLALGQWTGKNAAIDAGFVLQFKAQIVDGNVSIGLVPQVNIGAIGAGTWSINGNVNRLTAGSTDTNWTAHFVNLAHLNILGAAGGSVTASTIHDVHVGGDMRNMNLSLLQPFAAKTMALSTLFVKGDIVNSSLFSQNNVGSITADGVQGSTLFVGVNGTALPSGPTGFASPAAIGLVKIGGKPTSTGFRNSLLAAEVIDQLILDPLLVSNTPEISTTKIPVLSGITTLGQLFHSRNVTSEQTLLVLLRPTIVID